MLEEESQSASQEGELDHSLTRASKLWEEGLRRQWSQQDSRAGGPSPPPIDESRLSDSMITTLPLKCKVWVTRRLQWHVQIQEGWEDITNPFDKRLAWK